MNQTPTAEDVMVQVMHLPLVEQLRLLRQMTEHLEQTIGRQKMLGGTGELRLWGYCGDLAPAPSLEEIDAVRHEIWSQLRDDIT